MPSPATTLDGVPAQDAGADRGSHPEDVAALQDCRFWGAARPSLRRRPGAQGARGSHHAGKSVIPEPHKHATASRGGHRPLSPKRSGRRSSSSPSPPRSPGPNSAVLSESLWSHSRQLRPSRPLTLHTSGSLRRCCPCPQATVSTKMLGEPPVSRGSRGTDCRGLASISKAPQQVGRCLPGYRGQSWGFCSAANRYLCAPHSG